MLSIIIVSMITLAFCSKDHVWAPSRILTTATPRYNNRIQAAWIGLLETELKPHTNNNRQSLSNGKENGHSPTTVLTVALKFLYLCLLCIGVVSHQHTSPPSIHEPCLWFYNSSSTNAACLYKASLLLN